MILRLFFIFLLASSFLDAKEYPALYAQFGNPLYKNIDAFVPLSDIKELQEEVKHYQTEAQRVLTFGYEAEKSADAKLKQDYLHELRQLEKQYESLLHLLHTKIHYAVENDDYKLLKRLTAYEFENLLAPRALLQETLEYYKKKKRSTKIPFLEKQIHLASITKYPEVIDTPVSASFDPSNKKQKKSSKAVSLRAQNQGDAIAIFIENNNPYGVTVVLEANHRNMRAEPAEKEISLKANSSLCYTKLYPQGNNSRYSYHYSWIIGTKDAQHDTNFLYRLPYALGSSHIVSQGYNGAFSHFGQSQYAIDFAMKIGTKIYAARDGIVVRTRADSNRVGTTREYAKDGNFITIEHEDGTLATYYHLQQNGVVVKVGEKVAQGELLGYSGNTGFSSGPHLHFAVFKAKNASTTESIPVRFRSEQGIIQEPLRGKAYTAK